MPALLADFRREYGINLATEAARMSWEEFWLLTSGLGPESLMRAAWATATVESTAAQKAAAKRVANQAALDSLRGRVRRGS